jgi:hypothetical protein
LKILQCLVEPVERLVERLVVFYFEHPVLFVMMLFALGLLMFAVLTAVLNVVMKVVVLAVVEIVLALLRPPG